MTEKEIAAAKIISRWGWHMVFEMLKLDDTSYMNKCITIKTEMNKFAHLFGLEVIDSKTDYSDKEDII